MSNNSLIGEQKDKNTNLSNSVKNNSRVFSAQNLLNEVANFSKVS